MQWCCKATGILLKHRRFELKAYFANSDLITENYCDLCNTIYMHALLFFKFVNLERKSSQINSPIDGRVKKVTMFSWLGDICVESVTRRLANISIRRGLRV